MGTVDNEYCQVVFCYFLYSSKVWRVRVHGEESLSYNDDAGIWVFFSYLYNLVAHSIGVQVFNLNNSGARCLSSMLQAVVTEIVHYDDIIFSG